MTLSSILLFRLVVGVVLTKIVSRFTSLFPIPNPISIFVPISTNRTKIGPL